MHADCMCSNHTSIELHYTNEVKVNLAQDATVTSIQ